MSISLRLPQVPDLHEPPEEADAEGCIQCQMGSKLVLFEFSSMFMEKIHGLIHLVEFKLLA